MTDPSLFDFFTHFSGRIHARRRPAATGFGRPYGFALLLFVLLLAAAGPLAAQTVVRTVGFTGSCDFDDLQAAVDEISVVPAQERIVRIESGRYDNVAVIAEVGLTLQGGFQSCDSTAPTPGAKAVLVGAGQEPVVRVGAIIPLLGEQSGSPSQIYLLDNLELRGGRRGLLVSGPASVTVEDALIVDNEASRGGGVFIDGSPGRAELDLVRTAINGNRTVSVGSIRPDGGGTYCRGDGLVRGLEGNGMLLNETAAEGRGGGIYLDGCDLEAHGRFGIQLNKAHRGGGIATNGNVDILLASSLEGEVVLALNRAREHGTESGKGGGLYLEPGADLRVAAARIEGNRAQPEFGSAGGAGGAIFAHGARIEMFRESGGSCLAPCLLVSGNRASRGAALFATRGSLVTVRQTVFDGNVAEGAVLEIRSDTAGPTSLDLRHSVLTRNVAAVLVDLVDLYSFTGRHLTIAGNLALDTAIVAATIRAARRRASTCAFPRALEQHRSTESERGQQRLRRKARHRLSRYRR